MKNLFLVLISLTIASNLYAQQRQFQRMSAVYLTVNGNKNIQVEIDGNVYNLPNSGGTVSKTNAINGLVAGMHSLTLTTPTNTNRRSEITTQFNLRRNFDMHINVNANGSLELIEKKKGETTNSTTPMTSTDFNNLMRNVRLQRTTESRNAYLSSTFKAPNTYFTSIQVVQLLQQIRSESDRLPLAKLSFRTVTDPNNFNAVYGLFNVQENRNALEDYVNYTDEDVSVDNNTREGMQETAFNNLYQTIKSQWSVSTQLSSLTNAFTTSGNYFTANQAGQLIQLTNSESSRLQLAKLSYRTVVDPANFSTVANLLYSQNSRDELMAYINNGQVINTRTPMTESDFNALYQAVNSQFLPYAKMTYLTNTFNNAASYFTASQAKTLIQLVTNENNRLQLSKSVYRNLVDRANYTQLNDLFTLPASIAELNTYVQAFRD